MKLFFSKDACKSRIFLINIDGVACDHVTAICGWVNKTFDLQYTPKLIRTPEHDFGPISFQEAVETCFQNDDFVLSLKPYNGVQDFIKTISEISTVKFMTTRKYAHKSTEKWVLKHFGDLEVLFTENMPELEFSYMIDESAYAVCRYAAQKRPCFLMERPWNIDKDTITKIKKTKFAYAVKSYEDVISFLWSTNLFVSC